MRTIHVPARGRAWHWSAPALRLNFWGAGVFQPEGGAARWEFLADKAANKIFRLRASRRFAPVLAFVFFGRFLRGPCGSQHLAGFFDCLVAKKARRFKFLNPPPKLRVQDCPVSRPPKSGLGAARIVVSLFRSAWRFFRAVFWVFLVQVPYISNLMGLRIVFP